MAVGITVTIIAAAGSGRVSQLAPASGPATAITAAAPITTTTRYYDDGVVAVSPAPAGGDSVAYCMQRYKSYDPASGTYLGYDGQRHPCP